MKRILTVQDISCVGRCSLTVALPILSAMGVECSVLPTAVLSTHTMFQNNTFCDLTEELSPILGHWAAEGVTFDGLYVGYLGARRQIALMEELLTRFTFPMVMIDPVMGDHGRLYRGFDEAYVQDMTALCAKAEVVVPNVTEAALLTGMEYRAPEEGYVRALLQDLTARGPRLAIVTGVGDSPEATGAMGYDRETGEFYRYHQEKLPQTYHGTGDIFSSVFAGGMILGKDWREAVGLAAEFTSRSIAGTTTADRRYGVQFEQALPWLVKTLTP